MNITDRAARVLQEIDAELALADKATPGPWTNDGTRHLWHKWSKEKAAADPNGYEGEHITLGRFNEGDFSFITASRTGYPLALQCLRDALNSILRGCGGLIDYGTLTDICDRWEAGRK